MTKSKTYADIFVCLEKILYLSKNKKPHSKNKLGFCVIKNADFCRDDVIFLDFLRGSSSMVKEQF